MRNTDSSSSRPLYVILLGMCHVHLVLHCQGVFRKVIAMYNLAGGC
jgi:hypothetical protein